MEDVRLRFPILPRSSTFVSSFPFPSHYDPIKRQTTSAPTAAQPPARPHTSPHRPSLPTAAIPNQPQKPRPQGLPGRGEEKKPLTNVSTSTPTSGVAPLNFISCLPTLRQFFTASTRARKPYDSTAPLARLAWETKSRLALGVRGCCAVVWVSCGGGFLGRVG